MTDGLVVLKKELEVSPGVRNHAYLFLKFIIMKISRGYFLSICLLFSLECYSQEKSLKFTSEISYGLNGVFDILGYQFGCIQYLIYLPLRNLAFVNHCWDL